MERINLAILFGGISEEYKVSLSSAAAVIENLDRDLYHIIMIGITREGTWYRYMGSSEDIREDRWHAQHASCTAAFISPSRGIRGLVEIRNQEMKLQPIDIVFPVLHGRNGEDGTMQGLLELAGIPYIGCDVVSSAIGMDKAIAHTLVRAAGVKTARSFTFHTGEQMQRMTTLAEELGYPLFIKPARSGSSIGITKAFDKQELEQGIHEAFTQDQKIIVEQNIEGFEVGCAVLGHSSDPIIGEIDEIEVTKGFFNFEEKYSLHTSTIHLPARIDAQTAAKLNEIAQLIYRTLGCKGLARVDLFVTSDGSIVFNEVNTMPGFTEQSRYPNMLGAAGIPFRELLDRLIQLALSKAV